MDGRFEKYKGIHPGIVLDRELKRRALKQRPFALALAEHPQTFNAITKGKRNLTTSLALKIERELGLEEGTLLVLQVFYDIRKEKEKLATRIAPNLSLLRKTLFWDTEIEKIDWQQQSTAVIRRVFERGSEAEKAEILRFYGKAKVVSVMGSVALSTEPITEDE
ncbi:helix-turn-helix transcriptional regulator [Siphonobacter aquaeclarae]|uniref:Addiction module antidote protein, HigA family n=1 Tax=Siphonobacter aquaeclarae TaxID=563176 RepID=A0A1G9KHM0_9BACT|nr:plasmid maintenance system antidote protein [Siphonobacter aquaeclarae]SDL48873.1 addiction module antidote protein, HigA family [Siphonobacter aquaeclarae]